MNRRGFLKLLGFGTAALALPKTLLALGEKATETVKVAVENIKSRFRPRKIKPVGVWRDKEFCNITPRMINQYYEKRKKYNPNLSKEKLDKLIS